MPTSNIYVALLHHPVLNKNGDIVTSAITNFDIHDIARASRTYGLSRYFIVNPEKEQRLVAERICSHWQKGHGAVYNADRQDAFETVEITETLDEVISSISNMEGRPPLRLATSASSKRALEKKLITFKEGREMIRSGDAPLLILLGTAWGMTDEILASADRILEPIKGPADYNHLSVRSAAAIIFDRLLG